MIFISHRGLLSGPDRFLENKPSQIEKALDLGFDVELDIYVIDKNVYLGHDQPDTLISPNWLEDKKERLWIHCKNLAAIEYLYGSNFNYFWHENDLVTLTSRGYIWAYPGNQPIKNSIAVLPEIHHEDVSDALGVCTDYPEKYMNMKGYKL